MAPSSARPAVGPPGSGDGSIWQAGLDGSTPRAIVTGQNSPVRLAVPAPLLAFTPSPFSYGQAASQAAFTLTNIGAAVEGPLTVTLTSAAAFSLTSDTCTGTALAPGRTCTITVRFAPAGAGTVTAALTAASATAAASDPLTGT